jgi:hypothetical protein
MNTQPLVLFMPDYAAAPLNGKCIIRRIKNHNYLTFKLNFNTESNL